MAMDERTKSILLKCARTYFMVKNWEKALNEYRNLVREFPDDPFIVEPLSMCLKHMGRLKEAQEQLTQVVSLYERRGHPEKAEKIKVHLQELQVLLQAA